MNRRTTSELETPRDTSRFPFIFSASATFCYGIPPTSLLSRRFANVVRPSFDSIQALLLTSFVLLNDMKAEASWALMGLTCRLAQSLGLHRPDMSDENATQEAKSKEVIRRKLWWVCVWHDTLTSLSFDR